MTRTVMFAFAGFLMFSAASFAIPSAAQDDRQGMTMGDTTDHRSGGMMGGGMMGNGGMMGGGMMGNGGMMSGNMGNCCAGMMGNRGMMGGMSHGQRPNEQWRHRYAPTPAPDQG